MKLKARIKNFFKNPKKKKTFIIVTTIVGALAIITGVTFAYVSFTLTSSKDNLIKAGCLKVDFAEENNINLTNSLPTLDEKGLLLAPYKYTITNSCTTDAYYETNLGIINTSNLENVNKVKVAISDSAYLAPTIVGALKEGTLLEEDATVSKAYLVDTGYLAQGQSKTFELRMWVDAETIEMTGTLDAKIILNATSKQGPNMNSYTAGYKAISNNTIIEATKADPDYAYIAPLTDSTGSHSQSSGLVRVTEGDSDVYYFRGDGKNNYLDFAGFTWRIVKVNSDGSVKLVLYKDLNSCPKSLDLNGDGVENKKDQTTLEEYLNTENTTYKEEYDLTGDGKIDQNDYTRLTSCLFHYTTTKENVSYSSKSTSTSDLDYSSSNVKTKVESWYNTNLTDYQDYIDNTIFCNDTTNSNNIYGAYTRNFTAHNPSSSCTNTLTAKVGILTADEIAYAGGTSETENTDFYLYSAVNYWTMSPGKFDTNAYMIRYSNDKIEIVKADEKSYIKPVITLNKNALLSGTGSLEDRFRVIGLYGETNTYSDTTPPIINYARANIYGKIEISATDGAFGTGIAGYYISTSNTKPTLSDSAWISFSSEKYTSSKTYGNGTYYVWAKDTSGNISESKTVEISIEETSKIKPKLTSNLIPVYYDETAKVWKKADNSNVSTKYKWFDYANKKWANAVTLQNSGFEDQSGNDREITIDGATPSSAGLVFDGTNDAISAYEDFGVTLPATYTVTFKTTSFSTNQIIFGDYSNKIAFGLFDSNIAIIPLETGTSRLSFSTANLTTDTWYTATIVANSISDVKLYIDGTEQTATSSTNTFSWTSGSYIGRRYYTGEEQYYFSGTLKNFMTWDKALSKKEISTIASKYDYKSVPKDKLTTYFDFKEVKTRDYYVKANAGTEIPMNMINSMWVWIPRFSTTTNGSYNGGTVASPGAFNIKFVSTAEPAHDAFTFGGEALNGFWASKFEPSSNVSCTPSNSASGTGCDLTTIKPIIKPNMISWRGARISTYYNVGINMKENGNIYGLAETVDSHLTKNNEWGAIAYLTQSLYGRCSSKTSCEDITINNCSTYKTGIAGDTVNASSSSTTCTDKNNNYKASKGLLASTTGNITGIYDLNGGSNEYVMGNYSKTVGSSGFSSVPSAKYANIYTTSSAYTSANLQHALIETSGWYGNTTNFLSSSNTWTLRGGTNSDAEKAGLFYVYSGGQGASFSTATARYTLITS